MRLNLQQNISSIQYSVFIQSRKNTSEDLKKNSLQNTSGGLSYSMRLFWLHNTSNEFTLIEVTSEHSKSFKNTSQDVYGHHNIS